MARTKKDLNETIDQYVEGIISGDQLVAILGDWNYVAQDTNSSPWECDAQYVEGSWDDVQLAYYRGIIPEDIFYRICDLMDARES